MLYIKKIEGKVLTGQNLWGIHSRLPYIWVGTHPSKSWIIEGAQGFRGEITPLSWWW